MNLVFIIHLFFTIYMTGVIWFVQIVHYPLMNKIGEATFLEYEKYHQNRTFLIVGTQMLVEILTGFWLLWQQSYNPLLWWNIILLIIIWLSTFLIQSPLHGKLGNEYKTEWHRKLLNTNWIRTATWTIRSLILLSMLI